MYIIRRRHILFWTVYSTYYNIINYHIVQDASQLDVSYGLIQQRNIKVGIQQLPIYMYMNILLYYIMV